MVKCLLIVDNLPRFTRWILRARQATLCERFVKSLACLTGKKTEFMQLVRKNNIDLHVIEPERHNQNPCEGVI